MITIDSERLNVWRRLKLLLLLGGSPNSGAFTKQPVTKPRQRTHRIIAFFDLP